MRRRADRWGVLLFALNLLFLLGIWLNERQEESLRQRVEELRAAHDALRLELVEKTSAQYSRLQAVRQEAALATSRAHDVEVELEVLKQRFEEMRDGRAVLDPAQRR